MSYRWMPVALLGMAPLPLPAAQDATRGEQVYAAQKCAMCHRIDGRGNTLSPLDGVGSRLSDADIREWIVDPVAAAARHESTKQPPMPRVYARLPQADLEALVAYLRSLK